MFCPSCGTRNPDGSRFCGACGADLSARGPGSTPQAMAGTPQVAGAPAPTRPAAAARGRVGRGRAIAGVAVAVAVALAVAVGLRTDWFGLAQPYLVPGTYTIITSTSASNTMVCSIAEGDRISLTIRGTSCVEGDARVNQTDRGHLHVQIPITAAGLSEIGTNNTEPGHTLNLVVPRGAPDSIVGTWAVWTTDRGDQPDGGLGWMKVEDNGTFTLGSISIYDKETTAVMAESLKAGNFQGSFAAASGSWTRQDDGSFVLSFPDSDGALTFQYRR